MAIAGAASPGPPNVSPAELPGLEQPLLHAHGALHARSKEPAAGDHEAQCSPEPDGSTFVRTCFNGLNGLSGVGLLSIPYALSEGGWLSLALLLAVAAVCCYTGLLLQRCMAASPAVRGYPDIGALAFGREGRLAASAFLYAELYLVAIGFLILEGDNLDKLFPGTTLGLGGGLVVSGKQLFVVLVAVVILPTTWLRSLGVLAYVSASGVLASAVVVFCVLWAAVVDGVGFQGKGRMLNVSGLPTALGLYTFCYCGHAIFPTLCNSMKEKEKFSRVLIICFVACTLNYGSMAILGYLMYEDDVKSQVTLNLPQGKISSKLAIYTTLINPFSKYSDGDAARHGGRREAARREQEVCQHTDQDNDAAPLHLLPQDLRCGALQQGGGCADRRDHRAWLPGCSDGDVLFSEEDCSTIPIDYTPSIGNKTSIRATWLKQPLRFSLLKGLLREKEIYSLSKEPEDRAQRQLLKLQQKYKQWKTKKAKDDDPSRASEGDEAFLDEETEDEDPESGGDALRAGHHRLLVRQQRHGGAHAPDQEPAQVPVHANAFSCLLAPSCYSSSCSDAVACRRRERRWTLGKGNYSCEVDGFGADERARSQLMEGPEGRGVPFTDLGSDDSGSRFSTHSCDY